MNANNSSNGREGTRYDVLQRSLLDLLLLNVSEVAIQSRS